MAKYKAIRDTVIGFPGLESITVKDGTIIEAAENFNNIGASVLQTTRDLKEPNFLMTGQAWGTINKNDFEKVMPFGYFPKEKQKALFYLGAAAIVLFIILKKK